MKIQTFFKALVCGLLTWSGMVVAQDSRFLVQLEPGYSKLEKKPTTARQFSPQSVQFSSGKSVSILRTEQFEKVSVFKSLSARNAGSEKASPQSVDIKVTWATLSAQGFENTAELDSYLRQNYLGVARVEKDLFISSSSQPTEEPLTRNAWQYGQADDSAGGSNIFSAWLRATGQGVVVAVLDNGVTDHPDLRATLSGDRATFIEDELLALALPGFNPGLVCSRDGKVSWHGTEMQGIIGAAINGDGVAGIAHDAKIMPVRVLGECGGWLSDVARGVRWASGEAVDSKPAPLRPAQVINLSLGSPGESCPTFMQDAIDAASSRGAIVVASAGNTGEPVVNYPAACNNVIAVMAHTFTGDKANYSAYSSQVAISAPGGGQGVLQPFVGPGLNTTSNSGLLALGESNYAVSQGTSPAAAIVSGVIALAKELKPSLTVDQTREFLRTTATPWAANTVCPGTSCGPGLLDAFAFVNAAEPPSVTNPPVVQPVQSSLPATIQASDQLVLSWDVSTQTIGTIIYSIQVSARDGQFVSVPFSLTPTSPNLNFRVPSDWAGRVIDVVITATNIFGQRTMSTQTVEVQSASATMSPTPTTQPPSADSGGGGGGGSLGLFGLLSLALLIGLNRKIAK